MGKAVFQGPVAPKPIDRFSEKFALIEKNGTLLLLILVKPVNDYEYFQQSLASAAEVQTCASH